MCYAASMSCGSAPSDCRASRGPSIAAWAALSSGLALCCCTAATSFDGFSRNVSGADEPTGAPPRFEVAPDTADAACELAQQRLPNAQVAAWRAHAMSDKFPKQSP